jgi:hypothetical protein
MLADKLNSAGYKCLLFGGYPVTSGQVCDSFERGKPGTEKSNKPYEKPHHLHGSTGRNHCKECTYYWDYDHKR